uniref:Uncharacterized protein n=1 Tax=Anopheles farauti TaxID=69004 RepID=A0A182Q7Y6_9DIPT
MNQQNHVKDRGPTPLFTSCGRARAQLTSSVRTVNGSKTPRTSLLSTDSKPITIALYHVQSCRVVSYYAREERDCIATTLSFNKISGELVVCFSFTGFAGETDSSKQGSSEERTTTVAEWISYEGDNRVYARKSKEGELLKQTITRTPELKERLLKNGNVMPTSPGLGLGVPRGATVDAWVVGVDLSPALPPRKHYSGKVKYPRIDSPEPEELMFYQQICHLELNPSAEAWQLKGPPMGPKPPPSLSS